MVSGFASAQTRFAHADSLDLDLKQRLTEMAALDLNLTSSPFAGATGWVALSELDGFYAGSVTLSGYAGAFDQLSSLRSAGHGLKHVAFAPNSGHWVILYNHNDFVTSSGFSTAYAGAFTHLTSVSSGSSELKDVIFVGNSGALILSGKNTYWSQGISAVGYQDVLDRLAQLKGEDRTIRNVSIAPSGSRVVLHDSNGYWAQQVPSALFAAIQARAEAGHTLQRVNFGPSNQWVLLYQWKDEPLPITGPAIGIPSNALSEIDDIIVNFMQQHGINAAMAAIMRNNSIVYHRGFGWVDQSLGIPMPHDGVMRIASLTKPMTAALIRSQIEAGQYALLDPLFNINGNGGLLTIDAFPSLGDTRLSNVTVRDALQHRGGWDRVFVNAQGNIVGDITRRELSVGPALNVSMPPNRGDVARWMLGQSLQFNPGARRAYSNVGYFYLGQVVEMYAFQNYVNALRDLLAPLGVETNEIVWGQTLRQNHDAREPWYFDPGMTTNRFFPDSADEQIINEPYGGWVHENRISQGGLVLSTHAMLRIMQMRVVSGNNIGSLRNPGAEAADLFRTHTGGLPGTSTVASQRGDGINLVVFFNRGNGNRGWSDSYDVDIRDLIYNAIDSGTIRWPAILNPAIFGSAVGQEKGWKNSPLIGEFWSSSFADKWVHNPRFRWIYCLGSEDHLFFWNPRHGWYYTGMGTFPFVYAYLDKKWLYIDNSRGDSRWVFDFSRQIWHQHEPWE